jgi:two-component system, OmpR family, sensor histidine kinase BaeS
MRILHQLFLLLAAAVLLAVALVSAAVAWNLRTGFVDYLHARDESELSRLAQRVEQVYATDPALQTLRSDRSAMRRLIDSLLPGPGGVEPPPALAGAFQADAAPVLVPALTPGPAPGPAPGAAPVFAPGMHGAGAPPERGMVPAHPPPPLHGPQTHVLKRAAIRDAQDQHLAGPPVLQGQEVLRWPVRIGGEVVAYAVSPRAPGLADGDAQFLQRQYLQLALAAGVTLLTAGCAALWAARRWSRPLEAIKASAQRMASGDFAAAAPGPGKSNATLEIAELQSAINSMAASLQSLDGARRRWLAQISHELRTPLTVLRGELEAIEEGARAPTPAVWASLREEALHLTRLVADLHTLAMADLNGMTCNFDWGEPQAWLQRSTRRFAVLAEQAGLQLQGPASASVASTLRVYWDFERLAQALAAVLDNSLHYTQAPGRVDVLATVDSHLKRYLIEVRDSAPGVPQADLSQLFEPLFRSERMPPRGGRPGSGLGLAIAKSIVVAHGGNISARASALGGVSILIDLPWEAQ